MSIPNVQPDPKQRGEKRGIVDDHTPTSPTDLKVFEQFEQRADDIVRQLPKTPDRKDV